MAQLKDPQILTTNRLLDGVVVFFTGVSWDENISKAAVVQSDEELAALQAHADISVQANEVIDYYAIPVNAENGLIEPQAIREKIRVSGPTIDYRPNA